MWDWVSICKCGMHFVGQPSWGKKFFIEENVCPKCGRCGWEWFITRGRWVVDFKSGWFKPDVGHWEYQDEIPDEYKERESICPICGGDMKDYITRKKCRDCHREMSKEPYEK